MDAVTRQTSQHVEYEPEWEGAFNLQLKLADVMTMLIDWCSTDVSSVAQSASHKTVFSFSMPFVRYKVIFFVME